MQRTILTAIRAAAALRFRYRLAHRFGLKPSAIEELPTRGHALTRGEVILWDNGTKLGGPETYAMYVMVSNTHAMPIGEGTKGQPVQPAGSTGHSIIGRAWIVKGMGKPRG